MNNEQLALKILQELKVAVLKRVAPGLYEFWGQAPDFYMSFFPSPGGQPCPAPWEHSSMLELFLDDAESFFERTDSGFLTSGVWQEDGKTAADKALLATALALDEDLKLIIIRVLEEDYNERVVILRKARQQLLQNRALSQDLEVFKEKSQLDPLTKLFNRGVFMERLQDEINLSQSAQRPLSLLIMDIDDFKKINDTYGHIAGDKVLVDMGQILTKIVRRGDVVARYGGEEFVVLVPGGSQEQVCNIGEKIRKRVAEHTFTDLPCITISVGCSTYKQDETLENFIERADMALYDAKKAGKNTVRMRCY